MTALRMTRANFPPTPRHTKSVAVGALMLGLFGCGMPSPPANDPQTQPANTVGANDPAWLTSREKLPAPDLDRLDYDPENGTLSLYDLPGRDRWMVQLPNEPHGHFIGSMHRLPEGVDKNHTLVFYSRPGVKVSASVTVAAIEAGRRPHTSLVSQK